jgi:hypothetical protein
MLTREGLKFLLRITDYFDGHWEDPGWGQLSTNQILALLSVREWASGIEEADVRQRIQGVVDKAIANIAQKVARAQ